MAINLNNISQDDMATVKGIKDPPEFDAGDFSNSSDGFDSIDDGFFSDSEPEFSFDSLDSATSNTNNGQSNQSAAQIWGDGGFLGQNQQQEPQKESYYDKAFEASAEGMKSLGKTLIDMVKSFKNRTADDMGEYGTRLIKVGVIGIGAFVILSILGALTNVQFLKIQGFSGQGILAFGLTAGAGMVTLGWSAIQISKADKDSAPNFNSLPDASSLSDEEDYTDNYEDNLEDILSDLFETDDTSSEMDNDIDEDYQSTGDYQSSYDGGSSFQLPDFEESRETDTEHMDYEKALDSVRANSVLNRHFLLETFFKFLPTNSPDFSKRTEMEEGTQEFLSLETMCLKAMANIMNCEISEVHSELRSAYETFFTYELRVKRVAKIKNFGELASEIEAYAREGPEDSTVTCTVDRIGDDFRVIISKGVTAVVTIGDCLREKEVYEFFDSEKHQLPMITGITDLGEVIVDDAKAFDSMLVAGKPGSGKSWYVLSILISFMMFNTPDDVEFIIIDPKEAYLFKTLALMPHVAGLHNDDNILAILDEIINVEAPRRKKIFDKYKCDDIWALRKKGVKMPALYIIIDEYISVANRLGDAAKELNTKMQIIISQFRAHGIRMIFVPHRATGVVNKTNRTMLQFTCSVKGDPEDVKDTLGIKEWKKPLVSPGDIAVKTSNSGAAKFVRGAALTPSDDTNAELIQNMAKAFYKMGVEIPDLRYLKRSYTRDDDYIRSVLYNNGDSIIQYADSIEDTNDNSSYDELNSSLESLAISSNNSIKPEREPNNQDNDTKNHIDIHSVLSDFNNL